MKTKTYLSSSQTLTFSQPSGGSLWKQQLLLRPGDEEISGGRSASFWEDSGDKRHISLLSTKTERTVIRKKLQSSPTEKLINSEDRFNLSVVHFVSMKPLVEYSPTNTSLWFHMSFNTSLTFCFVLWCSSLCRILKNRLHMWQDRLLKWPCWCKSTISYRSNCLVFDNFWGFNEGNWNKLLEMTSQKMNLKKYCYSWMIINSFVFSTATCHVYIHTKTDPTNQIKTLQTHLGERPEWYVMSGGLEAEGKCRARRRWRMKIGVWWRGRSVNLCCSCAGGLEHGDRLGPRGAVGTRISTF